MLQQILIVLLFIASVFYLARIVYKQFTAKSACATGCGKCGAVDFAKIEQQLKSDTAFQDKEK